MPHIEKPEEEWEEQPYIKDEFPKPLSERDSIRLIELLENPPEPNDELKKRLAEARKTVTLRI